MDTLNRLLISLHAACLDRPVHQLGALLTGLAPRSDGMCWKFSGVSRGSWLWKAWYVHLCHQPSLLKLGRSGLQTTETATSFQGVKKAVWLTCGLLP